MYDKETMMIVEIIKATPDSIGEYYDFPMKLYADLAAEAARRNIPIYTLNSCLNRLPQQGLAMVYHSQSGSVYGITPTSMFNSLFA